MIADEVSTARTANTRSKEGSLMKNSVDQVVWIELLRRDIVTFNQEIDKIPKTEKVIFF